MNQMIPNSNTFLYRLLLPVLAVLLIAVGALRADFPSGPSPQTTLTPHITPPIWEIGNTAPLINAVDLNFHAVNLDQFQGKPLVIEFGSITEPVFRLSSSNVQSMARRWAGRINFLVIYQRESHPSGTLQALDMNKTDGFDKSAPINEAQRIIYATDAQNKLGLNNLTMAVDNWDNYTAQAYGNLPNMTFLIDANGRLVAAWPWMSPWQVNGAISNILANRPIAAAYLGPDFSPNTAPPLEFDSEIFDPAGLRAIASALDDAGVNTDQIKAILPALTDFHMAVLDFQGKAAKLRQNQQQFNNSYPQNRADQIADLRQKAMAFKSALEDNLTLDQYQQVMAAINHGRLARLFNSDLN
jgi:Iodothyronine deiodinase